MYLWQRKDRHFVIIAGYRLPIVAVERATSTGNESFRLVGEHLIIALPGELVQIAEEHASALVCGRSGVGDGRQVHGDGLLQGSRLYLLARLTNGRW